MDQLVEAATVAEALGIDTFWLGDEGLANEPFVTLSAVACATQRIALGIAAANPYLRHPALTAATAATLAEVARRPVHLAFARGGRAALLPLGVSPADPLRTLARALDTARAALGARTTHAVGSGSDGSRPQVDLWLAGRGPRIADLAARAADGFFLNVCKPAISSMLARVRANRQIPISLMLPLVLSNEQRELLRPYLALALLDAPPATPELVGITAEAARKAAEALSRGDIATAASLVPDHVMENMAVVGSPGAAARELRDLIRVHAVDEVGVAVWGDDLRAAVQASGEVVIEAAQGVGSTMDSSRVSRCFREGE